MGGGGATRGPATGEEQRKGGRGTPTSRKPDVRARRRDRFSGYAGEALRPKARVVANEHSLSRFFRAHHVARDCMRPFRDVFMREIFRDNAAPAVGPELNLAHGSEV